MGFHPLISWNMKREQVEENRDPMHFDDFLAKFGVVMWIYKSICFLFNFFAYGTLVVIPISRL